MKVMVIFGTRPEAIKMCPLILELKKKKEIDCKVCLTGQHREMLAQVMEAFNIKEDYNLDIMKPKQTLSIITAAILQGLEEILQKEQPHLILVHGDTTTSFVASLAAFYQKIPVGHVEAGLRTNNKYSPYPEEMNRVLTGRIADLHFAPTKGNQENLFKENIVQNVYVTGNTVIDAFKTTVKKEYVFEENQLSSINFEKSKVVLVTAHRRENWGKPLEQICRAIKRIADSCSDVIVVYPVHKNPTVRDTVYDVLDHHNRIMLIEPLNVFDMHNLIARSYMVMTDSGGLQEEAPACGKPVLVMRTETERPEAVAAGTVNLVGIDEDNIYQEGIRLLTDRNEYDRMAHAVNPYGDGHASERIVQRILELRDI